MGRLRWVALVLALLLCAGCTAPLGPRKVFAPGGRSETAELDAGLRVQLGLLDGRLTDGEYAACMDIWADLYPLRRGRLDRGVYGQGEYEARLTRRLRRLLDGYTVQYLDGDEGGFGYENPPLVEVARFTLKDGEQAVLSGTVAGDQWTQAELEALWAGVRDLLPDGSFGDFGRFDVFTDGPDETLAFVYPMDAAGSRWVLAVDPEDAGDGALFTETVLHEYAHYLTLNEAEVIYTRNQTTDTYNEPGLVSRPGSYLDDFYQRFWPGYIDDCLAEEDTFLFFLRHYDDFITPYASTDPTEDLCESFAFFVLYEEQAAEAVWEEKLNFFYDYPQLVEFRTAVRAALEDSFLNIS